LVAKLYHRPPVPLKAEKLRAMVATATPELLRVAAWPTATLHERPNGPMVGLLMPKVSGHQEAHTLYSPAHRKHVFPEADWRFLIRTATNCANAFDEIHARGHTIGDVNQSNVMVRPKLATVYLIDCDSYQVRWNGRVYPCEVGVPQFTPPELQSLKSFRGTNRDANHDRFGLAVLIFHLLFMGRHPFAGKFLGAGDMPLERAIAEYRFAFGRAASTSQLTPPPKSLTLAELPPDVSALFERAFGQGSSQPNARPTASAWAQALTSLEGKLKSCSLDVGHKYSGHLPACPWCGLMKDGAPNFFVAVAIHHATPGMPVSTFALAAVWAQIEQVRQPRQVYHAPPLPPGFRPVPIPLPQGVPGRVPPRVRVPRQSLQVMVSIIALGGSGLAPLMLCSAANKAFLFFGLLGIIVGFGFGCWWSVLEFLRSAEVTQRNEQREQIRRLVNQEYTRRYDHWNGINAQMKRLEQHWCALAERFDADFANLKCSLETARNRYQNLKVEHDTEFAQLSQNAEAMQRSDFLQSKYISDARIKNIGPGRQAVLISYGVETADDIDETTIREIPGFGPTYTQNLLDWRKELERQFRFDPKTGIPPDHVRALAAKFRQFQQSLQLELQQGAVRLKVVASQAEQHLSGLEQQLHALQVHFVKAEADLSLIDARSLSA
jgi:DNA-binding helix-hairpin-helix protein with protein kinase domain